LDFATTVIIIHKINKISINIYFYNVTDAIKIDSGRFLNGSPFLLSSSHWLDTNLRMFSLTLTNH